MATGKSQTPPLQQEMSAGDFPQAGLHSAGLDWGSGLWGLCTRLLTASFSSPHLLQYQSVICWSVNAIVSKPPLSGLKRIDSPRRWLELCLVRPWDYPETAQTAGRGWTAGMDTHGRRESRYGRERSGGASTKQSPLTSAPNKSAHRGRLDEFWEDWGVWGGG